MGCIKIIASILMVGLFIAIIFFDRINKWKHEWFMENCARNNLKSKIDRMRKMKSYCLKCNKKEVCHSHSELFWRSTWKEVYECSNCGAKYVVP